MNPWKLLGLEPTRDEREIKRAYTRLLRKFPPESDPDGFKALRTSYESALFLSKIPVGTSLILDAESPSGSNPGNAEAGSMVTEEASAPETGSDGMEDSDWIPPTDPASSPPRLEDVEPSWQAEAKDLLDRIEKDFPIHAKRQFADYWTEILDAPILWNLDAKSWVGWNLFAYIGRQNIENAHQATEVHIGKDAWILLDDTFGWLESEAPLHATFPEELADAVLDPIRSARGLKTAADMKPPPVQTLIDEQNRENRFSKLYYLAVPGVWLVIQLLNQCYK